MIPAKDASIAYLKTVHGVFVETFQFLENNPDNPVQVRE
jgi:hypothetical protein